MIITISGMPGSGKTTVAKVIAEKLKLKHYYMGAIRRNIAKEKGITLNELNKLAESDPSSDKVVDDYLAKLGKTEDDFVAEGRTAFHFIPDSIKIFMAVDHKVGAKRILDEIKQKGGTERNEKAASTVNEQAKLVKERIDSDRKRYRKYYGFDFLDPEHYDLWLDTTDMTPEQVVDKILKFCRQKNDV